VFSTTASFTDAHGAGFLITPDPANPGSGSFSGGTGSTHAYVDAQTIADLLGAPATFDNPTAESALFPPLTSLCEPTVSAKFTPAPAGGGASDSIAVKLKKPKGLKAITIGAGTFDTTNTQSTLTVSVSSGS
jgi:hypothetical protein